MLRDTSTHGEQEAQQALNAVDNILSGRWKALVLWLLKDGAHRYSDVAARLPWVTAKVLTRQLRELERAGIIERWCAPHGPRHVEYKLTHLGQTLMPLLREMHAWGARHQQCFTNRLNVACVSGNPPLGEGASSVGGDNVQLSEASARLSSLT